MKTQHSTWRYMASVCLPRLTSAEHTECLLHREDKAASTRPTAIMSTLIRKLISTVNAAKPVAPYNQAVVADRTVYVSGCLGLDKNTMKLVPGGAVEQADMALKNLEAVLNAADSGIDKVVKNTIYLKDLNDFAAVNEVYKKVFTKNFPARSCFQVARLPMDALVEIESIAMTGEVKTVTSD